MPSGRLTIGVHQFSQSEPNEPFAVLGGGSNNTHQTSAGAAFAR